LTITTLFDLSTLAALGIKVINLTIAAAFISLVVTGAVTAFFVIHPLAPRFAMPTRAVFAVRRVAYLFATALHRQRVIALSITAAHSFRAASAVAAGVVSSA
jgi:hypothetical protein